LKSGRPQAKLITQFGLQDLVYLVLQTTIVAKVINGGIGMEKIPKIQIIHLSTSHTGGAGIAARRLSQFLRSQELNSIFVALDDKSYETRQGEISIRRSITKKTFSLILTLFNKYLTKQTYFSVFSSSAINIKQLTSFGSPNSTIFHVHNWFNLLSIKSFDKLLKSGYQIIFTLHDQRLFTGGCHYSLHCSGFTSKCGICPQLGFPLNRFTTRNLLKISKIFNKYQSQITIVVPSKWLLNLSKSSMLLKESFVTYIPNVHFGFEILTRERQNIPTSTNKSLTLGIANVEKTSNLKGTDLVDQLILKLDSEKLSTKFLYLRDFNKNKLNLTSFWTQIDFLLVLSRADNSPNVIHEAKILGIPVIATSVGGITELLNKNYDFLINPEDAVEDTLRVIRNISSMQMTDSSSRIEQDYSSLSKLNESNHLELYKLIYKRFLKVS
jgi:glycosyltransferase involved in cell wall biosynthesis